MREAQSTLRLSIHASIEQVGLKRLGRPTRSEGDLEYRVPVWYEEETLWSSEAGMTSGTLILFASPLVSRCARFNSRQNGVFTGAGNVSCD
jgi:hypothetical protein